MIYRFHAYGHPNILGTHKTTLEFTKDKEVSLKGDCIVGADADFDLDKLNAFIKNSENKSITITIQPAPNDEKYEKINETIAAELNPNFGSDKEFVIRKTDFASERTFGTKADKAASDLNRDLIGFLKEKKSKVSVIIENNRE